MYVSFNLKFNIYSSIEEIQNMILLGNFFSERSYYSKIINFDSYEREKRKHVYALKRLFELQIPIKKSDKMLL